MTCNPELTDLLAPGAGPLSFSGRSFSRINLQNPKRSAIFDDCSFRDVRVEALPGQKATLEKSQFNRCKFKDCYFGPATLSLKSVAFASCRLDKVKFMLASLDSADFSQSRLRDVSFRSATLTSASFQGSTLDKVCFERANLEGADFTSCILRNGDFWGEPPWQGAIVPDEVRYSFGIVGQPIERIDQLVETRPYSQKQREQLVALKDWLQSWAEGCPEVMLKHEEVSDLLDLRAFVWILKELKSDA